MATKIKLNAPTAEAIARREAERAAKKEAHYQELLKSHPPGVSFYSYSLPNEEQWRRLDECPTKEFIDGSAAMQWTAGLIADLTYGVGMFVVTGVHHGSRVLEFQYVYKNKEWLNNTK